MIHIVGRFAVKLSSGKSHQKILSGVIEVWVSKTLHRLPRKAQAPRFVLGLGRRIHAADAMAPVATRIGDIFLWAA